MCVFLRRKQLQYFFFSFSIVLLGVSIIASAAVFPYLDKYKSPRPISEVIRSRLPADSPVYVYKSTMADFNYYARRKQIQVIGDDFKLAPSPRETYLIINEKDLKQFKSDLRFNPVSEHQVGERKWYLLRLF